MNIIVDEPLPKEMTFADKAFWDKELERNKDVTPMKYRKKSCHDCAVEHGLYTEISRGLAQQSDDVKSYISERWFCHASPNLACKGNATLCGVVK